MKPLQLRDIQAALFGSQLLSPCHLSFWVSLGSKCLWSILARFVLVLLLFLCTEMLFFHSAAVRLHIQSFHDSSFKHIRFKSVNILH